MEVNWIDSVPILRAMQVKADELGLECGAIVVCSPYMKNLYNQAPIGTSNFRRPENHASDSDKGSNHIALAFGMLFQSMRTNKPSCSEFAMEGETAAKGCVVAGSGGDAAFFSCSGGTEEQNVIVAGIGKTVFETTCV